MAFQLRGLAHVASGTRGAAVERAAEVETIGTWRDTVLVPFGSRAAAGTGETTASVNDDDVLTIVFDDGFRWMMTGEDFRTDILASTSSRRGPAGNSFEVPRSLPSVGIGGESRGFENDISTVIVSTLEKLTVPAGELAALAICKKYEEKKLGEFAAAVGDNAGILLRCELDGAECQLQRPRGKPAADRPMLVFLHGTASNTVGSFGALWSENTPLIETLGRHYEEAFAFEHKTLTVSPVANAVALLQALPTGATLHLVSHSRGGLIGELLCRAGRTQGDAFDSDDHRLWPAAPQGAKSELQQLNELLIAKRIKVERFVRVACPALGTTLASGKLDRWLSVVMWAAEKAASANPVLSKGIELFGSFAKALIRERTDPTTLPGLASMMPDGPLVRLLNRDDVTVTSDLSIIAGDQEAGRWYQRLLRIVPDLFFGGDHDLVVNTGSMFGGAERKSGAVCCFDQGPDVSHFRYFTNHKTAACLVRRLIQTDAGSPTMGFDPVRPELRVEPSRSAAVNFFGAGAGSPATDVATGQRPVVVVLPGIMGSELSVKGSKVWLSKTKLMFGGLKELASLSAAAGVEADGLLSDNYDGLCDFLRQTHDVIRFPFDWRLSVVDAADRLARKLKNEVLAKTASTGQPVRLLAHSMGGLVVGALIAHHGDVWQKIKSVTNSRAVLLGTPLQGSWSIVQMLLGQEETVGKLALLDLTNDEKELLGIISQFPGVLELLPCGDGAAVDECFDHARWRDWQTRLGIDEWPIPSQSKLASARQVIEKLRRVNWSAEPMVYVSGVGEETPVRVQVQNGEVFVDATQRGDGRVIWDLSSLNGVKRWFMETDHGSLANHTAEFQAVLDLLRHGNTTELDQAAPSTSRGAVTATTTRLATKRPPVLFPTTDSLAQAALGTRRPRSKRGAPESGKIKVSVVHGDLAFARYPVVVGHYYGDPIIGPERRLDEAFANRLTSRQTLGLYAGQIGTSEICLASDLQQRPSGAIVIGLGQAGELNSAKLERTFAQALLEFAIIVKEHPDSRFDDPRTPRRCMKISTLLIGTGADSISVSDSVTSILRSLKTVQRRLQDLKRTNDSFRQLPVELVEVEFIVLFQDRALAAHKALKERITPTDPKKQTEFRDVFEFTSTLETRDGHQRRISNDEPDAWWHRLQIKRHQNGKLEFVELTRRARAESRHVPTQNGMIRQLVEEATRETRVNQAVCHTLFEMLLPNALKESAQSAGNVQLVLNESAAALPWELVMDRTLPDQEPPAVKAGVLRQLEVRQFRERPVDATLKNACVIGEPVGPEGGPITGFPALPGAVEEANRVTDLLKKHGYSVQSSISQEAFANLHTLHREEYRILHLAGHGVHEWQPLDPVTGAPGRPVTGMVLGEEIFLGPSDVEQMRVVPDLVFINCCQLGKTQRTRTTGVPTKPAEAPFSPVEFAANIAAQFIRMGVRAVIAAGWDLDDAAALTFADSFYREILSGQTFGDAVREARKTVWTRHPQINSWGAYQCYGDPGWRLALPTQGDDSEKPTKRNWVAPDEVILELENLVQRAAVSTPQNSRQLCNELETLEDSLPEEWRRRADVIAQLGLAWYELAEFPRAVQHLDQCRTLSSGELPSRATERLCDAWSRLALDRISANQTMQPSIDLLTQARELLQNLTCVSDTSKRRELLCMTFCRHAVLLPNKEQKKARWKFLEDAADLIRWQHENRSKRDFLWPDYWLYTLRALLTILQGKPHIAKKTKKADDQAVDLMAKPFDLQAMTTWCTENGVSSDARAADDPSFWNRIWKARCSLLELLLTLAPLTAKPSDRVAATRRQGNVSTRTKELLDEISATFRAASSQGASNRDRHTIVQNLQFHGLILDDSSLPKPFREVANRLLALAAELWNEFQLPDSSTRS